MTVPVDAPDWANPATGMNVVTTIINAQVINAGAFLGPFDLTAYNSILIWTDIDVVGIDLTVLDNDTNQAIAEITSPPDALGLRARPMLVPISARAVVLSNGGTDAITVTMLGSTRNIDDARPLETYLGVQTLALPSAAYSGTKDIGFGAGHGLAYTEFTISGTLAGIYQVVTEEGTMQVADSSEMHTSPSGGGKTLFRQWIAPRNLWKMQFVVTTAATGIIRANTVYR